MAEQAQGHTSPLLLGTLGSYTDAHCGTARARGEGKQTARAFQLPN